MASQTAMRLCSSSTPKLATFKSPTPTLLPLPPFRSFSCSSSLPTPYLKASYGGIRAQNASNFKCYGASGASAPYVVSHNEVQNLAKFAVLEFNRVHVNKIKFLDLVKWEMEEDIYNLWIKVEKNQESKELKCAVSFGWLELPA